MIGASFNGNLYTTIIFCFSPTNDETDIITFENKLSNLVGHIPKYNVLIMGGDMDAQIGKDTYNKFCLHNSPNRNSRFLTQEWTSMA